jgi:alanine racemase
MTFTSPTLTVSLSAITANYQLLRERFAGRECGAVVKANAYGLGAEEVATALAAAGCTTFFVATLEEGIALRHPLPNHKIVVFHGVGEGEALAYACHKLIPCLNSHEQIRRWHEVAMQHPECTSILHIDTAMARLGLTRHEWHALAEEPDTIAECRVGAIMSHLACASEPEHPINEEQHQLFEEAKARFPELPTSFVNSAGIFLEPKFHCDLARPGCSLYGITPNAALPNPMNQVAELSAPIIQLRLLDRAQSIGYGATEKRPEGARLAPVAIGYADGIFRSLTGKLKGYIGEYEVPLMGRVTMDMLTFDVSTVPEGLVNEIGRITLIGAGQTVDDVAAMADTIGYEVFCRLGTRVKRKYAN